MSDKQVYDLGIKDLNDHHVWYFPMDESVEDELTVRPLDASHFLSDHQLIVKTIFIDSKNTEYVGYIYWNNPNVVQDSQPVMFVGDGCITFWNGITKPSWADYGVMQEEVKSKLPLTYRSVAERNLPVLSGVLEGLYYFDDSSNVQVL